MDFTLFIQQQVEVGNSSDNPGNLVGNGGVGPQRLSLTGTAALIVLSQITAGLQGPQLPGNGDAGRAAGVVQGPGSDTGLTQPLSNQFPLRDHGRTCQQVSNRENQYPEFGVTQLFRETGQVQGRGSSGRSPAQNEPHFLTNPAPKETLNTENSRSLYGATEHQSFQGTPVAPTNASSVARPQLLFWCEVCKVAVNSPTALEEHQRGKRHAKMLQNFEKLQQSEKVDFAELNRKNHVTVSRSENNIYVQSKGCAQNAAENKVMNPEIVPNERVPGELEAELRNKIGDTSDPPMKAPEASEFSTQESLNRGVKRKMREELEGENLAAMYTLFVCDLCYVKCVSQAAFNRHIDGKKHTANSKWVKGYQTMQGPVSLQDAQSFKDIPQDCVQPETCQQAKLQQSSMPPLP